MKCPLCNGHVAPSPQSGRVMCPSCGWGAESAGAGNARRVSEATSLRVDASFANLVGGLVIGGGIVAVGVYVVFGWCAVEPGALNVFLFACGTAAYAYVGWYVARPRALRALGMLGRVGSLSPVMLFLSRFLFFWIMLYPGRLIALAAVGVYRYVAARRRLAELQGEPEYPNQ